MQPVIKNYDPINDQSLIRQGAYHQSGYASAIYLRNKQYNLPPVYFRIYRNSTSSQMSPWKLGHGLPFSLEGGRLIDPLTISINECVNHFSLAEQEAFKLAFETDIINLLVGTYAEIKYVNILGNRKLNRHPVNFKTMKDYFGPYWFDCTKNYLEYFFSGPKQQENKIAELFSRAYYYVNKKSYWLIIIALADYLMKSKDNYCTCEQIISLIDNHELSSQSALHLQH